MDRALEQAIQQLIGMHYSEGRNVRAVCSGMGLNQAEWDLIKEDCSWLTDYEVSEIEAYLAEENLRSNPELTKWVHGVIIGKE